jgi:hypothetical protein
MRAVQDHAVNVRPAAHAGCSCGALVEVQTEWYKRRTASKTKATVVGDRLVLSPLGI